MKMRRVLTAALAAVMLCTTVPLNAMAAGGSTDATGEQGKLFLDKKAELTGDGSYTITMEAYATGKTTTQTIETGVPLDIVLVMDQSSSMGDELGSGKKQTELQKAAKNFVQKVYDNGKTYNVEHRIGLVTFARDDMGEEGPYEDQSKSYLNSGIYDENGKFVGYKDTATSKPTYEEFSGTMDTNGTYYVKVGTKYVQLTYNKGADKYVPVNSPATDRNDLYGKVNGKYEKAAYGEYTETTRTEVTPVEGTEGYVDANGNPLTWQTITVPGGTTYEPIKGTIQSGNAYYVQLSDQKYHKIWEHGNKEYWRDDTQGDYDIAYNISSDKKYFTWGWITYPAYEQITTEPTTKTVLTTADGKEYTGTVYTQTTETKTGWNVSGTPVTTVYELQKGAGKWQYKNGKKIVDYTNEQVYIQNTAGSVFATALVPVAKNVNGVVSKRGNFDTAIDSMNPKGATRIAVGVELGNRIFEANPLTEADKAAGRQRIMIVFTDGEPGYSGYEESEAQKALAEIQTTKGTHGAKVYTIGLYNQEGSKQKTFMEKMSSNTETDKKYYHKVTDATALDKVFQTIQQDISGSTTQVDLTADSILRDIMSKEGFELTDKTVVTVSVVPGDATNAADETQIKWGTLVPVLTLTNPTDGAFATGTYPDSTGKDMTIQASTHMQNPEAGKADLHTVDVTGFDYKDQYIAQAHKGSKLVVEITGIKALPSVTNDQNIYTNHCVPKDSAAKQSGIWAPVQKGEYNMKAPFPENPQTYMPSKSFVMDYAKPVTLDLTKFKMDSAINVDKAGYNPFASANTSVKHTYGNISLAADGKLTYSPKTMNWDGYDTFYVFGTTSDETVKAASANANGNVWAKVSVIPANNIYFEDSFKTPEIPNGTVGISYSGSWEVVTDTDSNANGGAVEDATNPDDNHGWIPGLKDETGDTDGSSHHAVASKENVAKASFTFTGTGVDVYSRTNGKTGTIIARLKGADGKSIKIESVDTLSASGEYYQVPTLSLHEDGKGVALPYGTYTVDLIVSSRVEGRYEYYLDGIRVYNPIVADSVVDGAYGPDEMNATFMEVRDLLLDANSFAAQGDTTARGPVFIDQLNNGTDGAPGTPGDTDQVLGVGTYEDLGPKNEVYLAAGQAISFKVDKTQGNKFFVGLKSPTGNAVNVSYGAAGSKISKQISHTGDMFYAIGADNGIVVIQNDGDALLAVTKLKITNPNQAVNTASVFMETDTPTLLAATRTFALEDPADNADPGFNHRVTIEDIFHGNYDPDEIRDLIRQILEYLLEQARIQSQENLEKLEGMFEDAFMDSGFGKLPQIGSGWLNPWRRK